MEWVDLGYVEPFRNLDMHMLTYVITLIMLLGTVPACAGEIMTFRELESYFYSDGKMERFDGRFEVVYFMEGDTITRIQILDLKNNEISSDKTTFHIDRKLRSDPTTGPSLRGKGVVRAIGRTGIDGVEILSIADQFIMSVRSIADHFEISRLKRIK